MRKDLSTLRYFREYRRLTQKQVAQLIGHRDRTMISRYERGLLMPTLRVAFKLTILYRIPLQEIFKTEFESAEQDLVARSGTLRSEQPRLL
jgi:transcriptional regulator with XRE-family HTH domain